MSPVRPVLGQDLTPSRGTLYEFRKGPRSETAIVVPTLNATLTDVVGIGLATGLFLASDNPYVKAAAAAGGLWMLGALVGKAVTLAQGPSGLVEVVRP